RSATRLFADPGFDGNPIPDDEFEPGKGENPDSTDPGDGNEPIPPIVEPVDPTQHKIRVRGVSVTILNERVQYLDQNGKLISESIKDYTKRNILNEYATLDDFIHMWTNAEKKAAIKDELLEHGILLDALREESQKDIDDFDLILHIAFDKKPLTKRE